MQVLRVYLKTAINSEEITLKDLLIIIKESNKWLSSNGSLRPNYYFHFDYFRKPSDQEDGILSRAGIG